VRALFLLLALAWQDPPVIRDLSHPSQALGGDRRYIAVLPPSYDESQKRYPVLYWLYGYEQSNDERTRQIASYAAAHDFIIVSAGPVESTGEFPLYFPELVEHVDKTLRTIADRAHRGISGTAMGGFMALWTAGKYADLVASASSLNGFAEAPVGPKGFPADCELDDRFNHDDVRTLQTDAVPQLLDFHAEAFGASQAKPAAPPTPGPRPPAPARAKPEPVPARAKPEPRPALFRHADPYPNFTIWDWEVASDRRQPGFTVLENVGARGFRSSVREWVPGGAIIPGVKLSLNSPALYPPGSPQTVTTIRLRDGDIRRTTRKADAQGRLGFDLDGDAYEIGISTEGILTAEGYDFAESAWATAGRPVHLKAIFRNKGAARSATTLVKWTSPNPGVRIADSAGRLFALGPGETGTVSVAFTADTPATARLVATLEGGSAFPFDILVHPPAEPPTLFQIADGVTVSAWVHGTQQAETSFGEGNGDNHAAPGETIAILFPDGESLRPAELFTTDACVDNTARVSDPVTDRSSIRYSLPSILPRCDPGHVVHMLARIAVPGKSPIYRAIEFPVWYRK
jgi:hypothetical protein